MKAHQVDYQIFGDDLQFVEVELDPGETVIAEAGMMMYMEDGIGFETKMGDGSNPKAGFLDAVVSVGKRAITGESLFMTHFSHAGGEGKRHVAFGAPYPGKIIAIDLDEANGELICQKDSFLCAALGTELSIAFNKKLGAGLFGGEGFILQRLRGDGMVFIHAGGTIVEKRLNNQKILVDTGCIVAFERTISYDIQRAGNLKSMIFGGEGLFVATLQGTGRIWLQSLPFSRLADRILEFAPSQGGKSVGEGSVISGAAKFLQR
ncbi:MAG: TIGR00266 family protein [Chloroflexi bacterium]|nr:TIGR00266 family protein [Chloroflexota bacterium]